MTKYLASFRLPSQGEMRSSLILRYIVEEPGLSNYDFGDVKNLKILAIP